MRIAVVGANGQLASDLIPILRQNSVDVVGLTHARIEIADLESVREALGSVRPDVVINTAAYNRVDEAEDRPDLAFSVNAVGPRNLALACRERNTALMHLSTDYVFSGDRQSPYLETDGVGPVNLYGISKAAGEMAIRSLLPNHWIVRSSGLYGLAGSSSKGGNFVETMVRFAHEGRSVRVVNDQQLTPTATYDLAGQLVSLVRTTDYGTYHATCQGACTWYEFAAEIFRLDRLRPDLRPQTTDECGVRARRPRYSVLENAGLKRLGIDRMPAWQDALAAYLKARRAAPTP